MFGVILKLIHLSPITMPDIRQAMLYISSVKASKPAEVWQVLELKLKGGRKRSSLIEFESRHHHQDLLVAMIFVRKNLIIYLIISLSEKISLSKIPSASVGSDDLCSQKCRKSWSVTVTLVPALNLPIRFWIFFNSSNGWIPPS